MGTRRQEIEETLRDAEIDFEALRSLYGLPVRVLEEDLRHIEKSARGRGERLKIEPATCEGCGLEFRRRPGRFATPGRCPSCRGGPILPMRLRLV